MAGRPPASIASRLEGSLSDAALLARQSSRASGIARLRAEAASLGAHLGEFADVARSEISRDVFRAQRIAKSYAAKWLGAAEDSTARAASTETLGALRRIAVTESSEAFSSGRAKYIRTQPRLGLLRVWDATLDKRTCPICSNADGTIVGAREPFPLGEPGGVHPWCRCTWTLLTPSESGGVTTFEPVPTRPTETASVPSAVRKAGAARNFQRIIRGELPERELKFLRGGFREESFSAVERAFVGADPTTVATKVLPPVRIEIDREEVILRDGRHRFLTAKKNGATHIRAQLVVTNRSGDEVWDGARNIPLPK